MAAPVVSVIMPTWNAVETVAESIASVLDQTHQEIELIVVDDHSSDATCDVVANMKDSRVRLLHNTGKGVSAARNAGLAVAGGAFVKYLDSDDLLNRVAIERQLARMTEADELSLYTCAWGRFYHSLADLRHVEGRDWQDLPPLDFLELAIGGGGTMPVMTWLIPRELSDQVGLWSVGAQIHEDTEYLTRLALRSRRVLFCSGAWGYYRTKNAGSLSSTRDAATFQDSHHCVDRICRLLLELEDSPRTRKIISNYWRRTSIQLTGVNNELARRSELQVAVFGGSSIVPSGGPLFLGLSKLIGWQAALRLKRRINR